MTDDILHTLAQDPAMREYVQVLARVGPPKKRVGEDFDANMGICACNKRVLLTEFRILNSGLVPVIDNVCMGCRHACRDMAVLACPKCHAVIGRLPAHKDKTGFEFLKGHIYHVDCCIICEPELIGEQQEPTFILEWLRYCKMRGVLIPDQWKNRRYKKPLLLGTS